MAADDLRAAIEALPHGWHARVFDQVESTMDEARTAARAGAPSRSVFVTDYQSAGRGRHGRAWQAPPGQALLMSILLRGPGAVARPWRSTALASVAMAEAIEQLVPLTVTIKWPNDLMLDGRKLAGILAESASDGVEFAVVVGIGVNVALSPDELAALGVRATSLQASSGEYVARADLLVGFVTRVDAWLAQSEDALRHSWQARLWGRNQRVRLLDLDVEEDVVVVGVSRDGGLRVRRADGSEHTTTTGELIL